MKKSHLGFTVVELTIIVIVIGILATIGTIGYGAWQRNVRTVAVKSDLMQASLAYESNRGFGSGSQDGYATELPSSVKPSDKVTLTAGNRPGGLGYCVTAISQDDATIEYYVSNKQKDPVAGNCTPKVDKVIDGPTIEVDHWGTVTVGIGTPTSTRAGGLAVTGDGGVYVSGSARQTLMKLDTNSGRLITVSGSGTRGLVEGAATDAQFRDMGRLVSDGNGGFYQSDINNNRVRKITADGTVSTLAGLHQSSGITIDSKGNLFVASIDSSQCSSTAGNGHKISKITPDGTVTTYAGSGICGNVDGLNATAQFKNPGALAMATNGTIYVQEAGSCAIRKITPAGYVETVAGTINCVTTPVDGQGIAASFREIGGIATDQRGNLYIADHSRIRIMTPAGLVSTLVVDSGLSRPGAQMIIGPEGNLWGLGNLGSFVYKVVIP